MGKHRYTCLDLFSGAGGLSRGFYDAGYNVVLGVDFDDAALKTFKAKCLQMILSLEGVNIQIVQH